MLAVNAGIIAHARGEIIKHRDVIIMEVRGGRHVHVCIDEDLLHLKTRSSPQLMHVDECNTQLLVGTF